MKGGFVIRVITNILLVQIGSPIELIYTVCIVLNVSKGAGASTRLVPYFWALCTLADSGFIIPEDPVDD